MRPPCSGIWGYYWSPELQTVVGMNRSCKLFAEVVQRVPKFAWAVFFLFSAHAQAWEFDRDPVTRQPHLAVAKHRAAMATTLDPAIGDVAMSIYLPRLEGDPARGLEFARRAARLLPNDTLGHPALGLAFERIGRCPEALAAYQRANEIDPFELKAVFNRAVALSFLRRTDEFAVMVERFLAAGGRS